MNKIILVISINETFSDASIKNLLEMSDQINFSKEAKIKGLRYDFSREVILLKLEDDRFPETFPGNEIMQYTIETAKEKYPFIFEDEKDVYLGEK